MEYHVKPLSKVCAATGEPLVPGSLCHSVLVDQDGEMVRLDYSPAGWTGAPEGTVGYWQCQVPEATEVRAKLDPHSLMEYFERIVEEGNTAQSRFAYVVALLLLQKRRLHLDETRSDGRNSYLVLSGTRGEGPFEILDLQLAEDEIRTLQSELERELTPSWS